MRDFFSNPERQRKFHWWMMVLWMFPGIPLAAFITYVLPDPHASFAILVVSLWANTASHWAAWQAVRAEESNTKT